MKIEYPENQLIIDRLQETICQVYGADMWAKVTDQVTLTGNMENSELSVSMFYILERLEAELGKSPVEYIMHKVKHGLTKENYNTVRSDFLQLNDIDRFADVIWRRQIAIFEECFKRNKLFYGQPVNEEAYHYICEIPELFFGKRYGNKIIAQAVPYQLIQYLTECNPLVKRYYLCHCQFARESILREKTVSDSMCYCSMGHVKLFWETALNIELEGSVLASALHGDSVCRFEFVLPDEIMELYVHS